MFEAADMRGWRGHDVVDADGHKLGELEAIYVDTGTDLPSFGRVKVGMPTRRRLVFMPFDQATAGLGYLRVCYDKSKEGCPVDRHRGASCPRETKRRSSSTRPGLPGRRRR